MAEEGQHTAPHDIRSGPARARSNPSNPVPPTRTRRPAVSRRGTRHCAQASLRKWRQTLPGCMGHATTTALTEARQPAHSRDRGQPSPPAWQSPGEPAAWASQQGLRGRVLRSPLRTRGPTRTCRNRILGEPGNLHPSALRWFSSRQEWRNHCPPPSQASLLL